MFVLQFIFVVACRGPLQDSAGLEVEPAGLPAVPSGWREAGLGKKTDLRQHVTRDLRAGSHNSDIWHINTVKPPLSHQHVM